MNRFRAAALVFIVVGIMFVIMSGNGRHAFMAIGLAFGVIGLAIAVGGSRRDKATTPPN